MTNNREHIAFTPAVKAVQQRKGSRQQYAKILDRSPQQTEITEELADYIAGLRSVYLATASSDGRPYVQHRGGPPGFLSVVDKKTILFLDFKGNRQFISQGNLTENPQAFLFMMDYRHRTRIKVWGRAEVREKETDAQQKMFSEAINHLGSYAAHVEQMICFNVEAWEANCRQHIPVRYEEEEVQVMLAERDAHIRQLEDRVRMLQQGR